MIQPIDKLIQISDIPAPVKSTFRLDTADGRFALADQLQADIDEWCQQAFDDGPREHLGASVIGHECDRHLWYAFRWFKHVKHSGRMQRLFQDGHRYEDRLIEMLVGIGCEFTQVDEATGKQIKLSDVHGHFGGSCDGMVVLTSRYGTFPKMLVEFKTSGEKAFNQFHDVQESKAQHWGQMCTYGYKFGLKHAIYFIVNKNNADMKIEVVELDWELGERLVGRAGRVIFAPTPPMKLTTNVSDFRCKFCDHYKVCQLGEAPDRNCRSCAFSYPGPEKTWNCAKWRAEIPSREAQLQGCEAYQPLVR